jgi:hypothetical protein
MVDANWSAVISSSARADLHTRASSKATGRGFVMLGKRERLQFKISACLIRFIASKTCYKAKHAESYML